MFQLDISSFQSALQFVERATGRPMAVSLNRGAKTAIIGAKGKQGAMQLTPKADKSAIRSISDRLLAGFVIRKMRAAGEKLTAQGIAEAVKKERTRRLRASGYTAYVGYSNAAKAFGGTGIKGVGPSEKKLAKHGYGIKANPTDLAAEFGNTAPAAELIGYEALQQGIDNAAQDLVDYGVKKLQDEVFNKVNA